MKAPVLSSDPTRKSQAFVLGWRVANLGGVSTVVRNLAQEFARSGRLASVVIEGTNPALPTSAIRPVPVLRLALSAPYERRSPVKALLAFCFRLPGFFWSLRNICRTYRIEIINPHFPALEHFGLLLFRRSGCFRGKLILSFHGSDIRRMLQTKGFERFLCRLLLRGADALVPCSKQLGEEILLLVPECASRIAPVPNGVETQLFDAERIADTAESVIDLPPAFLHRKRLLNIGAFEYKKGHDILLQAFSELRRSREDVCLIIAGQSNTAWDETERLVNSLGLERDVLLLRDVAHPKIQNLLRSCDLFVLSSRWRKGVCGEGFALALLEAAAAGRPVIATDACGVTELITSGLSGLVVPPERPDLLAGAIEQFLNDPESAARQARRLHDSVKRNFTWAIAHRRYLQIADSLQASAASFRNLIEESPAARNEPVETTSRPVQK